MPAPIIENFMRSGLSVYDQASRSTAEQRPDSSGYSEGSFPQRVDVLAWLRMEEAAD